MGDGDLKGETSGLTHAHRRKRMGGGAGASSTHERACAVLDNHVT